MSTSPCHALVDYDVRLNSSFVRSLFGKSLNDEANGSKCPHERMCESRQSFAQKPPAFLIICTSKEVSLNLHHAVTLQKISNSAPSCRLCEE